MPAVSGKQYRFFQAHRGDRKLAAVAKEFIDATPPEKRKLWSHANKKGVRLRDLVKKK